MKTRLSIFIKTFLIAVFLPLLLLSYQNCAKSADDGNGQPYGGVRSFYHLNQSDQVATNSTPTNSATPGFISQKANLLAPRLQEGASCQIDSRIDLINNSYFLFNNLCNSQTTPSAGQLIATEQIKNFATVPLLNYNSALWQEATSQDLVNPAFLWYLNACSNTQGVYFDMQSPDLASTYANVQIQKNNKDLGSSQNEIVKIILKNEGLNYKEVPFEFDAITTQIHTVDLGVGQSERTITRSGNSTKSNATLLLTTVETIIMGNTLMHENHLTLKEVTPTAGPNVKTYYDEALFCM